ncbi:hypothetical protein E2C00_08530 [Streptomyces sp. WAC05374]|uniref:hypothetical protein n=1 Tax=Streptomyces sp. WAC05374 TaxID=2487420 RepID=UPI000F865560|nr:hypothetical protein [Streptomyces sp. WAC05374]RST19351.1 hypothetical protein EF905_01830 [Streptomyces sp. WAC05374]TDF47655.1 hypothetical protein E2C02_30010 [Streptomyces sp. WAC05374]TDF48663.1 hypothetical protein E2B92_07330 [Streptomyces sp. WAC05374]TDF59087.1 hypothetical protein E2C00_08530 [Streptomyces sp. WAC05374]
MEGSGFAFDELNIVARGAFTPVLLRPAWLGERQLVSDDDLSTVKVEVISPTATLFTVGAFRVQVTPDGLQISTNDLAETERARDLALGILHGHNHTPLAALGLNRTIHFTPGSEREWHAIGDRLVPKDTWEQKGILDLPGMVNVTLQGVRPDKYGGYMRVHIQPSNRVPYSVYIAVNDHFTLRRVENQPTARETPTVDAVLESESFSLDKSRVALEVLAGEWSSFLARSEKAIKFVSGLGGGRQS